MRAIDPRTNPRSLVEPMRHCAKEAQGIVDSIRRRSVDSDDADATDLRRLAELVVTVSQAVAACANACEDARNESRRNRAWPGIIR